MKIKLLTFSALLCASACSGLLAQTSDTSTPAASSTSVENANSILTPSINNGSIFLGVGEQVQPSSSWSGFISAQGTTFTLSKGCSVTISACNANQPTLVVSTPHVLEQNSMNYGCGNYYFCFTGAHIGSTDLTFSGIDDQGKQRTVTVTIQVVNNLSSTNALDTAWLIPADNGKTFTLSKSAVAEYGSTLGVELYNCTNPPTYTLVSSNSSDVLEKTYEGPECGWVGPLGTNYTYSFMPNQIGTATLTFKYYPYTGPQTISFTINVVP